VTRQDSALRQSDGNSEHALTNVDAAAKPALTISVSGTAS
jgi:hypothetical protein